MKRLFIALAAVALLVLAGGVLLAMNSRVESIQRIDGMTERYYFFGKLTGERNYRNGELNGLTTTYYGGGKVKSEWSYKNGEKHGTAKHYTLEGHLRYQDEYVQGKRIARKAFDELGNLVAES